MSFGCSPSDVLALVSLVTKVYQGWRDACGEYADITGTLHSLNLVLQRLQRHFNPIIEEDHLLPQTSDSSDSQHFAQIVVNCRSDLSELRTIVKKYRSLESSSKKTWDRIKLGTKNLDTIRIRLTQHITFLSAFLIGVQLDSGRRLEQNVAALPDIIVCSLPPVIENAINTKVSELASSLTNYPRPSLLTTYSNDDKCVWRQFRRELIQAGIKSDQIKKHRIELRGILDSIVHKAEEISESSEISSRLMHLNAVNKLELLSWQPPVETNLPKNTVTSVNHISEWLKTLSTSTKRSPPRGRSTRPKSLCCKAVVTDCQKSEDGFCSPRADEPSTDLVDEYNNHKQEDGTALSSTQSTKTRKSRRDSFDIRQQKTKELLKKSDPGLQRTRWQDRTSVISDEGVRKDDSCISEEDVPRSGDLNETLRKVEAYIASASSPKFQQVTREDCWESSSGQLNSKDFQRSKAGRSNGPRTSYGGTQGGIRIESGGTVIHVYGSQSIQVGHNEHGEQQLVIGSRNSVTQGPLAGSDDQDEIVGELDNNVERSASEGQRAAGNSNENSVEEDRDAFEPNEADEAKGNENGVEALDSHFDVGRLSRINVG